jgi:hypothetical protein
MTCNQVCGNLGCQFDVENSRHVGNAAGAFFHPEKASKGNWLPVECSSVDHQNANFGATDAGTPDGDWTHADCIVSCACNECPGGSGLAGSRKPPGLYGNWFTASSAGMTCNQVCAANGGTFDVENSRHVGNAAGNFFHPEKASKGNWLPVECSSVDHQNANFGAADGTPDGDWTHADCIVSCACK